MNEVIQELAALGRNIRRHREQQKLSQEELAEKSGLNRTYLSDVERGRRNLSFGSLLAIAQGLGLTVAELVANIDHGRQERGPATGAKTRSTTTIRLWDEPSTPEEGGGQVSFGPGTVSLEAIA